MPGWEHFRRRLKICLDGYWQNVQIASPWVVLHPFAMLKALFYGAAIVFVALALLLYSVVWGSLSIAWFAVRAMLWLLSLLFLWSVWLLQNASARRSGSAPPAEPDLAFRNFLRRSRREMTGLEYEQYVAHRLRREKYRRVEVTQGSGDYGADILAVDPWGYSISIQCKYYHGKVGVHAVQEIIAAQQYYGTERAMVITNSAFTQAASRLAEQTGVDLVEFYID